MSIECILYCISCISSGPLLCAFSINDYWEAYTGLKTRGGEQKVLKQRTVQVDIPPPGKVLPRIMWQRLFHEKQNSWLGTGRMKRSNLSLREIRSLSIISFACVLTRVCKRWLSCFLNVIYPETNFFYLWTIQTSRCPHGGCLYTGMWICSWDN